MLSLKNALKLETYVDFLNQASSPTTADQIWKNLVPTHIPTLKELICISCNFNFILVGNKYMNETSPKTPNRKVKTTGKLKDFQKLFNKEINFSF